MCLYVFLLNNGFSFKKYSMNYKKITGVVLTICVFNFGIVLSNE